MNANDLSEIEQLTSLCKTLRSSLAAACDDMDLAAATLSKLGYTSAARELTTHALLYRTHENLHLALHSAIAHATAAS